MILIYSFFCAKQVLETKQLSESLTSSGGRTKYPTIAHEDNLKILLMEVAGIPYFQFCWSDINTILVLFE